MNDQLPAFLVIEEPRTKSATGPGKYSLSFVDKTFKNVASFIKTGQLQAYTACDKGLLQAIHARVKIIFLLSYIVLISFLSHISSQLVVFTIILFLYILSGIRLAGVYRKIFLLGFIFGFVTAAPAALNVITNGKIIIPIIHFLENHQWWIYHIPATIGITQEGTLVVFRFFLKVTNSVALTLLVFYTTPFNEIIKSFKMLGVPDMILMVVLLTYKFIFILAQTIEDIYLALKSRWWNIQKKSDASELVAGRIIYLFKRSWTRYEEVFRAMTARGFTGKIALCYPKKFSGYDFVFFVSFIGLGIISCLF